MFTNRFERAFISPAEQYLFANEGEHFRLWRVEGEELVSVRTAQHPVDRFVSGAAVSPDGRLLATSARDIFLGSLPALEVVGVLKGHTRASTRLAFSPDGRTLASIADDRTVRLWHVSTQRELIRFQTSEQDQGDFQVEFSPDGRALAARRLENRRYGHYPTAATRKTLVRYGIPGTPKAFKLAAQGCLCSQATLGLKAMQPATLKGLHPRVASGGFNPFRVVGSAALAPG